MHIHTILNQIHKLKGFVYAGETPVDLGVMLRLEIQIRERAGSRPICKQCGRRGPGYDRQAVRHYEFIPLWGILVYLVYAPRRVNCPRCGVGVERLPWADGKRPICTAYAWFLAGWAKRLAWSGVAEAFHTSWHTVEQSVQMAVAWGREHMDLQGIRAIGVDEIAWAKGHTYATLVYQIDAGRKRLLWVGERRNVKSLLGFFRWLGKERAGAIAFVCSDMWKPYLKVIAKRIPRAIHVLDRFHIMAHLNKAVDQVRAEEAKAMKRAGLEPLLKRSRWCLLKRVHNLSVPQLAKLKELTRHNLRTMKAYMMKEDFHQFWDYVSPWWAGKFLDAWCTRAVASQIEPFKAQARMLRGHRELILNWFRARKEFSSGVVEGLNNKAKLSTKMAYGYSSFKTLQVALYHRLGDLPQPEFTHRFF